MKNQIKGKSYLGKYKLESICSSDIIIKTEPEAKSIIKNAKDIT